MAMTNAQAKYADFIRSIGGMQLNPSSYMDDPFGNGAGWMANQLGAGEDIYYGAPVWDPNYYGDERDQYLSTYMDTSGGEQGSYGLPTLQLQWDKMPAFEREGVVGSQQRFLHDDDIEWKDGKPYIKDIGNSFVHGSYADKSQVFWDPNYGWYTPNANYSSGLAGPLLGTLMVGGMAAGALSSAGAFSGLTAGSGAGAGTGAAATGAGAATAGGGWSLADAAGSILSGLGSVGTAIGDAVGSVVGGIGSLGLSGVGKIASLASTGLGIFNKLTGDDQPTGGGTRTTGTGGPGGTATTVANTISSLLPGTGGSAVNAALLPALLSAAGNAYFSDKWGDLITDEGMSDKLNPMGPERKFYKGLLADYYRDPLSAIEKMPGYGFAQNAAMNALNNRAGMTRRFMGSAYPQWLQDRAGQVAAQYANQYENNLARLAGADIGPGTYGSLVNSAMTNQQQLASNSVNALAIAMGAGQGGTNVNVNTQAGGAPGYTTNSDGIRLRIGDPHAVTGVPDFSFTEGQGGEGVVDDFWGTPTGAWDVTGAPDYSFTDQDW